MKICVSDIFGKRKLISDFGVWDYWIVVPRQGLKMLEYHNALKMFFSASFKGPFCRFQTSKQDPPSTVYSGRKKSSNKEEVNQMIKRKKNHSGSGCLRMIDFLSPQKSIISCDSFIFPLFDEQECSLQLGLDVAWPV